MLPLDFVQVAAVIFGNVNIVVRELVELSFDTEIQHKRRTGKNFPRYIGVIPASAQTIGHEPGHCVRKIGVDHDGIGPHFTLGCAHAGSAAAFKQNFLHRGAELNLGTEFGGYMRHLAHQRIAAAGRMPDSVLIFEK